MISILLNGQQTQIDNSTTVLQLLLQLELAEKRLAVEVNQEIIPRSEFKTHHLKAEDKVEIVQAIGGGSH